MRTKIRILFNHCKSISFFSKMSSEKKTKFDAKIGTHDGTFHCDEVFACYMLKQLPHYKEAHILRTRDTDILKTCDIVVDVGGVYDPNSNKFDHHQKSFNDSMSSLSNCEYQWSTKLSSAGLIYYHFGKEVIQNILMQIADENTRTDSKLISSIYKLVYENFVEAIDAIDNGINISDDTPRYKISTHISSRIGYLNLPWNHPCSNDKNSINEQFEKAMALIGSEFTERILFYANVWWPARSIVFNALNKRHEIDHSNEVLLLEKGGCPWKEHLFQLESELDISPTIKYVIYQDTNGSWRIQCVPKSTNTFENRLSLPEKWRGQRDEQLSKITGLDGCIFAHATGFIGGHKLKEGALEMAKMALQQ